MPVEFWVKSPGVVNSNHVHLATAAALLLLIKYTKRFTFTGRLLSNFILFFAKQHNRSLLRIWLPGISTVKTFGLTTKAALSSKLQQK